MEHDESLSFAIFNWYPGLSQTANNHFVVTAYMRIVSQVFGASEFTLRSLSVASYCGFVLASGLLARRFACRATGILFWLTLNSSALILGYSILARGYSFSVSFSLFGVCLLCRTTDVGRSHKGLTLCLAALCFSLASLSILSFVYLIPSALTIIALISFSATDVDGKRIQRFDLMIAPLCFFSAVLIVNLARARELQSLGELYYGSEDGIVFGTFKSLVESQGIQGATSTVFVILLALVSLSSLFSCANTVRRFFSEDIRISFHQVASLFLGITVVSTVLVPLFSGSLYPVGRVAIYMILPLTMYSFVIFDRLFSLNFFKYRKSAALSVASGLMLTSLIVVTPVYRDQLSSIHLAQQNNPSKAIVNALAKDINKRPGDHNFTLGAFWGLEPSLNFYRITRHAKRLDHVNRKTYGQEKFDYIYDRNHDFVPTGSSGFLLEYEQIAAGPSDDLPIDGAIYRLTSNR